MQVRTYQIVDSTTINNAVNALFENKIVGHHHYSKSILLFGNSGRNLIDLAACCAVIRATPQSKKVF